jgi:hypothetical protein
MIDVVKTIKNFKELMPDLTVDKALALIECIVENNTVTLTQTTYPWIYNNNLTCTDSTEQILKAAPHL